MSTGTNNFGDADPWESANLPIVIQESAISTVNADSVPKFLVASLRIQSSLPESQFNADVTGYINGHSFSIYCGGVYENNTSSVYINFVMQPGYDYTPKSCYVNIDGHSQNGVVFGATNDVTTMELQDLTIGLWTE